jgi:hypothetical protein
LASPDEAEQHQFLLCSDKTGLTPILAHGGLAAPGCLISKTSNHVYFDANDREMTPDGVKSSAWHAALAEKYRQAALYPWLPVEPDPPEPE